MNMLQTIVPKSDQINADDLIGGPLTITITEVRFSGGQEQPVSMYFDGSDKAFRPCKSMCRVLVAAWGADAKEYVGRSLTLYRDPTVKWGGLDVGGIRISHMTHIDSSMTMALTATKGSRKPFTVKPLVADQKPDKAADGVKTLLARIASVDPKNLAAMLADPVVVKQRAWLATNRPELAKQIDDAAGDDPFEGPADEQRGDQHDGTSDIAQKLIARLKLAKSLAGVDALELEYTEAAKPMLDPSDQELVETEIEAARAQLTPKP